MFMSRFIAAVALCSITTGAAHAETSAFLKQLCGNCVPEKVADCDGFLEGVTFDPEGVPWAVGVLNGNVMKVVDGKCEVQINTGGQPNGAKFARDGRLILADKQLGILAFDRSTKALTVLANAYKRENFRGVNDLVIDTSGGIYFTEPYGSSILDPNGRVFYLSPGPDKKVSLVAASIAFPNGIALSPDGSKLYVAEYAAKRILSVPSLASAIVNDIPYILTASLGNGVGRPDGLTTDAEGNIYAASMDAGEVAVFDKLGRSLGTIALPKEAGHRVTNVGFSQGYLYVTEGEKSQMWRVKLVK